MMLKKRVGLSLALCWCVQMCFAQGAAAPASVVPITKEPSHHLLFENEYVRVFKVEVAPHAETLYHKHDVDYVFVTLGDSDVESVRVGEPPVRLQLKDGETRFTKGGFAHKAVNNSDKPFVNVTVELKKNGGPLDYCEPCSKVVTKTNKSRGKVTRTSLLFSKDVSVSSWDLTGNFTQAISIKMSDFLLIPLSDFQSEGAAPTKSQAYRAGEAVWSKAGIYHWNPKAHASFIAIEFGRAE
jgi:quercetin dioxygenase-like cupin family protein